jgi:DUF2934 family protein
MAKSTKPRSTTTPRTTRAGKSAATPETTTFETATLSTASVNAATLETTTPARDLIAMRAYELFLRDGAAHGRDVEHWLRAERELRERASRN